MRRLLPVLFLFVLTLAACAPAKPTSPTTGSGAVVANQLYIDPVRGFSIMHPSDWFVRTDSVIISPEDELQGTSFIPPKSYGLGTDLFSAEMQVALRPTCLALPNGQEITFGTQKYTRGKWEGVGAGNRYEGYVFTTQKDKTCATLTLFLHRCNLGPDCGPEHDQPFDPKPLLETFEGMVQTFKWLQ